VRRALAVVLVLTIGAAGPGVGQFAPPGTGGVAALAGILEQLGANKRVLVIGAHPDDEDTQLLVLLSRGLGAQAAYLSLTRGEGGQNLIGPELGSGLGIIRTEELLAARELDGARQYFTRAYDFGFSKSADESFRFWPRDSLLKDVLEVIRRHYLPTALVIPARRFTFDVAASAAFPATGVKITETKATGNVTFSSYDTSRANRIDAGAVLYEGTRIGARCAVQEEDRDHRQPADQPVQA